MTLDLVLGDPGRHKTGPYVVVVIDSVMRNIGIRLVEASAQHMEKPSPMHTNERRFPGARLFCSRC
jgi:hypothetical protein